MKNKKYIEYGLRISDGMIIFFMTMLLIILSSFMINLKFDFLSQYPIIEYIHIGIKIIFMGLMLSIYVMLIIEIKALRKKYDNQLKKIMAETKNGQEVFLVAYNGKSSKTLNEDILKGFFETFKFLEVKVIKIERLPLYMAYHTYQELNVIGFYEINGEINTNNTDYQA